MSYRMAAICIAAFAVSSSADAGDLVYRPINPSFGGNTFNGSYLLSIATAQNEFDNQTFTPIDPLERFGDDIQRRVLSQAAREVTDRIFGEGAQDTGEFSVGNSRILFEQIDDQVALTLINTDTGAETNLTIPTPQF